MSQTAIVPADARAVCDSIAMRGRSIVGASVEMKDTVVHPENRSSVNQDLPPEVLAPTPACLLRVEIDSTASRPTWFTNWTEIWLLGADGSGSSSKTLQRGLIRCEVSDQWDMDVHGDTTVVGRPTYSAAITCWRHNREIIPSDTGRPPA